MASWRGDREPDRFQVVVHLTIEGDTFAARSAPFTLDELRAGPVRLAAQPQSPSHPASRSVVFTIAKVPR